MQYLLYNILSYLSDFYSFSLLDIISITHGRAGSDLIAINPEIKHEPWFIISPSKGTEIVMVNL